MKRLIILVVFLMVCLSSAFAQTSSNVEKAVRFRAPQKDATVEVKSEAIKHKSEKPVSPVEPFSLKLLSSAQLKELGGGNSRYANGWLGSMPNATQLKELGPRYQVWWIGYSNALQLQELGPRYQVWWIGYSNAPQLHKLGGNMKRATCFTP